MLGLRKSGLAHFFSLDATNLEEHKSPPLYFIYDFAISGLMVQELCGRHGNDGIEIVHCLGIFGQNANSGKNTKTGGLRQSDMSGSRLTSLTCRQLQSKHGTISSWLKSLLSAQTHPTAHVHEPLLSDLRNSCMNLL